VFLSDPFQLIVQDSRHILKGTENLQLIRHY